jgi:hypothetical protein
LILSLNSHARLIFRVLPNIYIQLLEPEKTINLPDS